MSVSSPSPYQSFAKILSSYHEQYAEPGPSSVQLDSPMRSDAVLDEEGGLLVALMSAIEETIRARPSSGSWDTAGEDQMTGEEQEALLLEHRTWQLLRAMYDNRLQRADPEFQPLSAEQALREDAYIPPEDLAQLIVNEDEDLSLWATLVEHLQSRPLLNKPPPLEARHGYLPTTLRRAKTQHRTASTATSAGTGQTSLDPDFTLRDPQGPGLAGEDATYQGPLLETLWDLVRHGELDAAIRVCEQGGEPWRGASLMGGRRWTMGGLMKDSMGLTALEGNRARALWKKSCRAIAKNPVISSSERALYAALTSDLQSLLPSCSSWEDHLWAHVLSRVEARLEVRWRDLGGFWEEESRALGNDEEDAQVRGGLEEVFASMAAVQKEDVASASRNPYYVAQRMIILGKANVLISQFADRLVGLEESVSPELVGPLVRFFAHLVLVLRSLGQSVPDTPANAILEAYLHILEREGNDHLVAMYAACLREGNGEDSYARFLRTMDPNATKEARMEALARAKTHNLDVAAIARETVRLILEEAFATIPALSSEQPDITSFATGLSERDVQLIRAIEWLTFVPDAARDALVKSNDVARYFLALGQANAAQALLKTLPPGVAQRDQDEEDPMEDVTEHEHFRELFAVFACHEVVQDVLGRQPKATATKLEQHNWRKSLLSAIERVQAVTIHLLTSDWLLFHIPDDTAIGIQRTKELGRIRQIFIPDLVLRLHTLLMSQRHLSPSLLQSALDLTKVVATEENHVYSEFFTWSGEPYRLVAYLDRVREASLAALESGSGSAFVVAR